MQFNLVERARVCVYVCVSNDLNTVYSFVLFILNVSSKLPTLESVVWTFGTEGVNHLFVIKLLSNTTSALLRLCLTFCEEITVPGSRFINQFSLSQSRRGALPIWFRHFSVFEHENQECIFITVFPPSFITKWTDTMAREKDKKKAR